MPLHHYLPASFLARFSSDSTTEPLRDRLLIVGDKKSQRYFNAPASKVGCINNLYTLINSSSSPDFIDQTWKEYERQLPFAIDSLVEGNVTAELWTRVLIPFVACMLVRGPDFTERFNRRWPTIFHEKLSDRLTQDNANNARLVELQRLLGSVVAAKWLVLTANGNENLITNDLGYSPFAHPQNGDRGMAIPLGYKKILVIVPSMEERPILREEAHNWVPIINYLELPRDNHEGLNKALAKIASRFIFGSETTIVQKYIEGIAPTSISPEPILLGFPDARLARAYEFTWHRLVGAIKTPPSDKEGWNFSMDFKALSMGWCPGIIFPINLIEFPPALQRVNDTIRIKFYDPEVYYSFSVIQMLEDLSHHEKSIQEATKALDYAKSSSLRARVLSIRGGILADIQQFDKALADFDEAIVLDPNNSDVFVDYGYALLKANKAAKAFEILSKAIALNQKSGRAYVNRSVALLKINRLPESVEDSTTAIELLPDGLEKAGALVNRGNVAIELGSYQQAADDLAHAASLYTDNLAKANCFTRQAFALKSLDNSDGALGAYDKALELNPVDYKAIFERALLHLERKETREALKDIDTAILHAPDPNAKAEILRQCAVRLSESMLFEEANKRFNSSLLLTSNKASVAYDKGLSLLYQANLSMAIEAFKTAMQDASIRPKALNNLGICLSLQGKDEEAVLIYREGIDLSPKDFNKAGIYRNLAVSLAVIGQYKEAYDLLKHAGTIDPKEPRNVITKGRVEFLRGDYRKASKIQSSLALEPNPLLVPCLLAIEKHDNALILLKTWLSMPHYPIELTTLLHDLQILKQRAPDIEGIDDAINLLTSRQFS